MFWYTEKEIALAKKVILITFDNTIHQKYNDNVNDDDDMHIMNHNIIHHL